MLSKLKKIRKSLETFCISWGAAMAVLMLRATCRVKLHNDPRKLLKQNKMSYIYSVIHAHQVSAIVDGEPGTGAMVSRSADGQIIVPALRMRGIVPIRGSGMRQGKASKGGLAALDKLVEHVKSGHPAYLAVDGPAGPRGYVHKGAAVLGQRTGAAVLTMVAIPSKRWVLTKAWDRLQIPKPFCTIHAYFGKPMFIAEGESSEQFRIRIEESLRQLELEHDPMEAPYFVRHDAEAVAS